MKVVRVSVSPPVSPSSAPATVTLSQATAPGGDKIGVGGGITQRVEGPCTLPQTVLASRECWVPARLLHSEPGRCKASHPVAMMLAGTACTRIG